MATIPFYNRQVSPQTQSQPRGSMQAASAPWDALAGVGQVVQGLGEKGMQLATQIQEKKKKQNDRLASSEVDGQYALLNTKLDSLYRTNVENNVPAEQWDGSIIPTIESSFESMREAANRASPETQEHLRLEIKKLEALARAKHTGNRDLYAIKKNNERIDTNFNLMLDTGDLVGAKALVRGLEEDQVLGPDDVAAYNAKLKVAEKKLEDSTKVQAAIDLAGEGNLDEALSTISSLPEDARLYYTRTAKELNKKFQGEKAKAESNRLLTDYALSGNATDLASASRVYDSLVDHGFSENEIKTMQASTYWNAKEISLATIETVSDAENASQILQRDTESGLITGPLAIRMRQAVDATRDRIVNATARNAADQVSNILKQVKSGELLPDAALATAEHMDAQYPGLGFGDGVRAVVNAKVQDNLASLPPEKRAQYEEKNKKLLAFFGKRTNLRTPWQSLERWAKRPTYQDAFRMIDEIYASPEEKAFLVDWVLNSPEAKIRYSEIAKDGEGTPLKQRTGKRPLIWGVDTSWSGEVDLTPKDPNLRRFLEEADAYMSSIPNGHTTYFGDLLLTASLYNEAKKDKKLTPKEAQDIFDGTMAPLRKRHTENQETLRAMMSAPQLAGRIMPLIDPDGALIDEVLERTNQE